MSAEPVAVSLSSHVAFFVAGVPVPQGSKNAIRQGERTLIVERGRAALNPWRSHVAHEAARLLEAPLAGPLGVRLVFYLSRPKSHYRSGASAGTLKAAAPVHVATRPDVDKLARAVLDALTGVAFTDDGQVAELVCSKLYGVNAGVDVAIRTLA